VTVLVLDVDGVVVLGNPQGGRWDRWLARDLGIAPETLQAQFFRRHWRAIALGEADMLQVLDEIWHELACATSARRFVDYWFAQDSLLNHALLAQVDAWRGQGNKAFLATVQEHHRAEYLWQTLGLQHHFDAMHYSAALGAAKPDLVFYERVQAKLPVAAPGEVMFLDDSLRNVEAAMQFGWRARQYTGVGDLVTALAEISEYSIDPSTGSG
jgi:putative hydrolase of the HAD superfamily